MIQKRSRQISTLLKDSAAFVDRKFFDKKPENDRVLFVNVKNPNLYHRFFYLLLKFYKLAGYRIVYPMNFSKFRNLRNGDQYLSLITKEPDFLSIKNEKKMKNAIVLKDEHLSADYFKDYFEGKNAITGSFHIPMSFHPLMYHKNLWNTSINTEKIRGNSLFCYGNFDDKAYLEIDRTEFNVINRRKLYDFFQNHPNFYLIKNKDDLQKTISEKLQQQFIFVEKYVNPLPMEAVRETLSNFRFFLCCPGVVMPLCHNVVEAMSVGTVPVIQKEYADVMYPNLEDGKNAVIFNNFEDLKTILNQKLFNTSEKDFKKMSRNCLDYYNKNLSPEGMVFNLNQNLGKNKVYLNAEHRSIKFVR